MSRSKKTSSLKKSFAKQNGFPIRIFADGLGSYVLCALVLLFLYIAAYYNTALYIIITSSCMELNEEYWTIFIPRVNSHIYQKLYKRSIQWNCMSPNYSSDKFTYTECLNSSFSNSFYIKKIIWNIVLIVSSQINGTDIVKQYCRVIRVVCVFFFKHHFWCYMFSLI